MTNFGFGTDRETPVTGPAIPLRRVADPLPDWQFDLAFFVNQLF